MGAGARWSNTECKVLSECWIAVSEDPIKGSDQQTSEFWESIYQMYDKKRPRKVEKFFREASALQRQWSKLRKAVSKFAGCFKSIVDLNESGKTIEQQVEDAIELYDEENSGIGIDGNDIVVVWRILRDKRKWKDLEGAKQQRPGGCTKKKAEKRRAFGSADSNSDAEITQALEHAINEKNANSSQKRPIGRKSAKALRLDDTAEASSSKAIAAAAAAMAAATSRKTKIAERKLALQVRCTPAYGDISLTNLFLQILTQSEVGLADDAKECLKHLRVQVIKEQRDEVRRLCPLIFLNWIPNVIIHVACRCESNKRRKPLKRLLLRRRNKGLVKPTDGGSARA